MNLKLQRRLAAAILKCSTKRVVFNIIDDEIKQALKDAITKDKIKELIEYNVITKKQIKGTSRVRAKKLDEQRKKGRRRGQGSRKGTKKARLDTKEIWMNKVRLQRNFIRMLKQKNLLDEKSYRQLYKKIKGSVFRNKKHLKTYIIEKNLIKKK